MLFAPTSADAPLRSSRFSSGVLCSGDSATWSIVIALDRDVDLHRAVSLLERGCPPDLALQILF